MGLTVMDKWEFERRYLELDARTLLNSGVLKFCPHAEDGSYFGEAYQFDEEEVAALAAAERLRDKPPLRKQMEESVGYSLSQFVGTKFTDGLRQQIAATAVQSLEQFGCVEKWSMEVAQADAVRLLVDLTTHGGERVQLNLELRLSG